MPTATFIIDGGNFSNLDEFYDEVERVLIPGVAWGHNLDAFNDILAGVIESCDGSIVLRWRHCALSRERLGYEETLRQLTRRQQHCHSANRSLIVADLEAARCGRGPTVFDRIVEIIKSHNSQAPNAVARILLVLE